MSAEGPLGDAERPRVRRTETNKTEAIPTSRARPRGSLGPTAPESRDITRDSGHTRSDSLSVGSLGDRIRACVESIADRVAELHALIVEADESREWERTGYASLRSYLVATLDGVRGLDREQRAALAHALADRGLTVREIAPIVGVSKSTIATDLRPVSESGQLATMDVCALAADHAHDADNGAAMLAQFWAALTAGRDPVLPTIDYYRHFTIPSDRDGFVTAFRAKLLESRMAWLVTLRLTHVVACSLGELQALAAESDVTADVPLAAADPAIIQRWERFAATYVVPGIAELRAGDANRDPLSMPPIYAAKAWAA